MKPKFLIKSDGNEIEFIESLTHDIKSDVAGRLKKKKLKDDIIKFKYTKSLTKQGEEVMFKRHEFEVLVRQKLIKRIC